MRRALLVTVGTVAGLATVLSYSDGQVSIAGDLASAAGPVDGLGAPPAEESPAAGESASPSESPSAAATGGTWDRWSCKNSSIRLKSKSNKKSLRLFTHILLS